MHKPIQIQNLCLSFPHKTCFEDFNATVHFGSRIAIIGSNGSGKTTLLNILRGESEPKKGKVICDAIFGYVPQIIQGFKDLSGGEKLNKALTQALRLDPNVLVLDEPTNHLDRHNRKSLMRMLKGYTRTLIVASHDRELLRSCVDTLWHIDQGKIHIFHGSYEDYRREVQKARSSLENQISYLNTQKKDMHDALMKEQNRASKSKAKGEKSIHQRKWPTIVSTAKAGRAQTTSGRKKSAIDHKKQDLTEQLNDLRLPEIITPHFSIKGASIPDRMILSIQDGKVGYDQWILKNINFSVSSKDRIAILGDNASGKSTLIKAILNDESVMKSGDFLMPNFRDIGYLDQHYNTLSCEKTVFDTISDLMPSWSHAEVRRHLNDFLFRKNEEVNAQVATLSGGEKARLCLAQIAAFTPKLLILDEITNNLDLETREHVIEVLKHYPGAMLVISHDLDFLYEIDVHDGYLIEEGELIPKTICL